MHIPDGFLTGTTAAAGAVVGAGGIAICLRAAGREARERQLPLAGLAAAFFLVGDAPMVPITVGTQGHLLGGGLAVCLLGPWLGALTIAVVAVLQAVVFGDGGVSTLGLTVVMLALLPAFAGYPLARALRRLLPDNPRGIAAACGVTAATCVLLSAGLFVLVVDLGHRLPLDIATLAIGTLGAYAVIAVIEGLLTAMIVSGVLRVRPDLVRVARPARRSGERRAVARRTAEVGT